VSAEVRGTRYGKPVSRRRCRSGRFLVSAVRGPRHPARPFGVMVTYPPLGLGDRSGAVTDTKAIVRWQIMLLYQDVEALLQHGTIVLDSCKTNSQVVAQRASLYHNTAQRR
jgi:hypothetical protein